MKPLFPMIIAFTIAMHAFGANFQGQNTSADHKKVTRVGGTYIVSSIDKDEADAFRIEFKSAVPSGKFDIIRLTSDHVHVAVKLGQKIRISAEILRIHKQYVEAAQVLVFLPQGHTSVPVWLLSNKSDNLELRGSRYLEMHAPDYYIF